jgi:secreted PhoX family phosphatase
VEFAGATFSPDGTTLYVNLNASPSTNPLLGPMSVAIWGPWDSLRI